MIECGIEDCELHRLFDIMFDHGHNPESHREKLFQSWVSDPMSYNNKILEIKMRLRLRNIPHD